MPASAPSLAAFDSNPFFTRENVPAALLSHHNTAAGVFGQLCVMEGTVTYYGFANEQAEGRIKLVISAGEFATSPPQYWHRVELSDDARFQYPLLGRAGRLKPATLSQSSGLMSPHLEDLWLALPNRLV